MTVSYPRHVPRLCSACGSLPCRCATPVDNRLLRMRPVREPCVCGGPEIVAASPLDGDIVDGVQRHQIEPVHIRWDLAHGTPLTAAQLEARQLDRELVGGPA